MTQNYDLIIVGGGPAAMGAGVYAARKKLKTLILAGELGGQSAVSPEVQNWIGEISLPGKTLVKKIEAHLRSYEGDTLKVVVGQWVIAVAADGAKNFAVATKDGRTFLGRAMLLTVGGRRRRLTVLGADTFEHKGLTYCASCDGPLFTGQDVAVVGGGNAGFGTAGELLAYCRTVTLLESSPTFRAEQITIDKLTQNPNFKALNNIELLEIKGDKFVSGLDYHDRATDQTIHLPVTGIFVEIGFLPNTEFLRETLDLNPAGKIVINHRTQATSRPGIWAAGDCTDGLYQQNNIAVGDAVKAVEDIQRYLQAT